MYTKLNSKIKIGRKPEGKNNVSKTDGHEKVAKTAYYAAEKRGFAAGHELEDWFTAERAIKKKGMLTK